MNCKDCELQKASEPGERFTIDFGEVGAFERVDAQVEAGNVLHVGEHRYQRVELIGQPEIGERNLVEWSGECFVLSVAGEESEKD